jgi:hypothetical protein
MPDCLNYSCTRKDEYVKELSMSAAGHLAVANVRTFDARFQGINGLGPIGA